MSKIIDSRDKWPFPAISEARKAGAGDWVEISEEAATDLLNVLPPIYIPGGFMVSEAADHDARGVAIYCAVVNAHGRYLAAELPSDMRSHARTLAEAVAR